MFSDFPAGGWPAFSRVAGGRVNRCGVTDVTDSAMITIVQLTGLMLVCIPLLPAMYGLAYMVLRVWGKLGVSQGGWQAASVLMGGAVVVTALGLFRIFAAPMRWESGLRRRLTRGPGQEELVSDVVVDVVRIA